MIVCQKCHNTQPDGTIFCLECGAKIIGNSGLETQSIKPFDGLLKKELFPDLNEASKESSADIQIKIHILKSGEEILLEGQQEFTIGRISEGQSIVPDIDLAPYNAYQEGVSRIHASIRQNGEDVELCDLGSINGTMINEQKIPPSTYHSIKNGDIIMLGRLKFQLIIRY